MLNLSQHSITKVPIPPMATLKQYLMAIQLLSPFTLGMLLTFKPRIQRHLKITKNPEWKTKPHSTKRKQHKKKTLNQTKNLTKKKKNLTSLTIKLSITIRQICKERLEGINKQYLGNQQRNLGYISQNLLKLEDQP